MRSVVLRGDGNPAIGFGHVYRLLAIADILKEDFECTFVSNNPNEFILGEIKKTCSHFIDLNNKGQFQMQDEIKSGEEIAFDMEDHLDGDEIVVTDGYLFGTNYQLAIKETGAKLVCVDDLASTPFYADIVINHAPGIDKSLYKIQPYTQVLTGLNYAIVRRPFFKPLKKSKGNDNENKAFISLGGSDFYGYTEKLADILITCKEFETIHILYSSSFHSDLIDNLKGKQSRSSKIKLHCNLNSEELVDLLDNCTHAFVSASTVLIESYSRSLTCFAGYYTNNQKFMYNGFIHEKMALGMGDFQLLNTSAVSEIIRDQVEIRPLYISLSSNENIHKVFLSLS